MTITNVSRHCQMSPGGGGTVDPGENYSVQCFGESVSRGWCKPLDSLRCSEGQCGVRAERPALSVPQLQWGTTSRDHQTHQEGGTGGRKEGQAQKKADQGVVCYPHLPALNVSLTTRATYFLSFKLSGIRSQRTHSLPRSSAAPM